MTAPRGGYPKCSEVVDMVSARTRQATMWIIAAAVVVVAILIAVLLMTGGGGGPGGGGY
jgi:predicted nucleic acid-binding Zn ribbon protein